MAVNLGDLPTWFADIGTVGALGAALWQIRTERNLRHKRDQKEQASAPPRAGKAHFRCHRTRRPDGQAVGPTRAHCDLPDKRLPRAGVQARHRNRRRSGAHAADHRELARKGRPSAADHDCQHLAGRHLPRLGRRDRLGYGLGI